MIIRIVITLALIAAGAYATGVLHAATSLYAMIGQLP